jgi:sortase (surface protein transpeptidase)
VKAAFLTVWFTVLLAVSGMAHFGSADVPAVPPPPPAPPAESPAADLAHPAAGPAAGDPHPTGISIPAIRVASTFVPLGLNPDGSAEVPPIEAPKQAGWYRFGPGAGEVGPFVVLGHVDSYTEAGVFYRLRDLRPGDLVFVDRQDRSRLSYVVDRVTVAPKDRFPTDAVYGDVARPEIRLITCGGAFDRTRRSYEDNVIVFGHLV